jgi:hypothetical protein
MTYEQRQRIKEAVDQNRRRELSHMTEPMWAMVDRSINHALKVAFGYEAPKWHEGFDHPQGTTVSVHRRHPGQNDA